MYRKIYKGRTLFQPHGLQEFIIILTPPSPFGKNSKIYHHLNTLCRLLIHFAEKDILYYFKQS